MGKIFANHIFDMGSYPKYIKNSYNPIAKSEIIQIKNGQKMGRDILPKKACRWPTGTCQDAQYH